MSLSKHTITNLIGSVMPMALALITVPFYLKYIGGERYGVLVVIWTLFGYVGFFDFGFGKAVAQRLSKPSMKDAYESSGLLWTAIICTFLLGVIAGLILWLPSEYILLNSINMKDSSREEAIKAIEWLFLALPFLLPTSVLNGALQARLRFFELNIIHVIGGALAQLLPLILAASGYVQLQFLVPAVLIARLITIGISYGQCKNHVPLTGLPRFESFHLKPLLSYGGWVSLMSILSPLLVTADRMLIATLSGAKAVTHYSIPYDLVSRLMVISSSLSSAIFPRLASANVKQANDIAIRATNVLVAIITPVIIFALFVIHPFLIVWLGVEFSNSSAKVSEIILLGVWINSLVIPHHARLMARDNPKIVVIIYLIQIPVYFLLLWMGIIYFGIVGAAIAWTLRVLLDTVMLLVVSGVFVETIRMSLFPFSLITVACVVNLFMGFSLTFDWILALILILVSLFRDRYLLIEIFSRLKRQ